MEIHMAGRSGKPRAAPAIVLRTEDVSASQPKKHNGCVSTYDPAVAELICAEIAVGKSLYKIAMEHACVPSLQTVYHWTRVFPEFSLMYTRAREDQQSYYVDQLVAISDDNSIPSDQKRVMVDTRKWLASKLNRTTYGDVNKTEHTGPGGGPIQTQQVATIDASSLDADARDALKQALLAAKDKVK
jgi:hypothetical protein